MAQRCVESTPTVAPRIFEQAFSVGGVDHLAKYSFVDEYLLPRGCLQMSIITQLLSIPGVIAVGEFSPRGELVAHGGLLDSHQARMAAVMCNANSLAIHMQAGILDSLVGGGGLVPIQGWIVRGSCFTVCVVGQRFCFLEQETASVGQVLALMRPVGSNPPADPAYLKSKQIGSC